ncbi:MAG: hypothetical protein JWQ11_807, partial [Rhizobacter sp.]|nr:hypothetical protein [Rhizobacter sp.]
MFNMTLNQLRMASHSGGVSAVTL